MVSLQASQASEERKACLMEDLASNKRKREEGQGGGGESTNFFKDSKLQKAEEAPIPASVELHLDTPLPLDWQRCLDVKSGKIHYYNSRTQKRTSRDPRASPEPPSSGPSLNLELNLMTCEPQAEDVDGGEKAKQRGDSAGMTRSVSWVSLEADEQEMVAAVCMRCHMLVMMCRANPSCPNCKFVNPPDRSNSGLLKPRSAFYVGRIDVGTARLQ